MIMHIVHLENGLETLAVDGLCTDKDRRLQRLVVDLAVMVGVVVED